MKKITLLLLLVTGLALQAQPVNEVCAAAVIITGNSTVNGTNTGATFDNVASCGTSNTGPGVWYSFEDNSIFGSMVTVSTCNAANYNTKITVFKGSCDALVCVDGNDDSAGCGITSEVAFMSDGYSDYYILVHGFGAATGNFDLTVTGFPPNISCEEINDGVIGAAFTCSANSIRQAANDILVNTNEDFTLYTVRADIVTTTTITDVAIIYYADNNGSPGTIIGTETGLSPVSDVVIGQNGAFDIREVVVSVTPFELVGQISNATRYWIELSVDNLSGDSVIQWGATISSSNGLDIATRNNGAWDVSSGLDGLYEFEGQCLPHNSPPTISCPGNISQSNDISVCGAVVNFPDATANDAQDGALIATQTMGPPSGSMFPLGITTIEFMATDTGGLTTSCQFDITITDTEAPLMACQDITLSLDATGIATISETDVDNGTSDNCGLASVSIDISSFDCNMVGANNVTLTATDVNGNTNTCLAVVTVEDTILPTAICQNITVQLDGSGMATITSAMVDNGSSDACGIASLTLDNTTFNCSEIGVNTVTLTVTDANGNVATCTGTVTVEDIISPIVVCQDITVQVDANGLVTVDASDVVLTATDNCGMPTLSLDISNFDCDNIGVNNVILTATDAVGNSSSCTAIITVVDDLAPIVSCSVDQTVDEDTAGGYELPDYFLIGDFTTIDNCTDPVMYSQMPAPGTVLPVGVHSIVFTAEDDSGNVSTCSFELTVVEILGISKNEPNNALKIYPNPTIGDLYLANSSTLIFSKIQLFDMQGKLVHSQDYIFGRTTQKASISHLPAGMYFVQVSNQTTRIIKKVIKY